MVHVTIIKVMVTTVIIMTIFRTITTIVYVNLVVRIITSTMIMMIDARNIIMRVNINLVTMIKMTTKVTWIVNITQMIVHINSVLIKRTRLISDYIVTRTIIPMIQTIFHIHLTTAIKRKALIIKNFIAKMIKRMIHTIILKRLAITIAIIARVIIVTKMMIETVITEVIKRKIPIREKCAKDNNNNHPDNHYQKYHDRDIDHHNKVDKKYSQYIGDEKCNTDQKLFCHKKQ